MYGLTKLYIYLLFLSEEGKVHTFYTVEELSPNITLHYRQLLKFAEDKITEMCKASKELWVRLGEEEQKCMKWVDELKRVRDEQVRDYIFSL